QCWSPQVKCRSRMHYYLAEKEVQRIDAQANALLLDLDGNVTETGTANFLFVNRGCIVSPPRERILPGISLAIVRRLTTKLGLSWEERTFQVHHVMHADEAFLTSTPYCILPVTRLNSGAIGTGRPGPVFRRLLDAWSQEVGLDIQQQIFEGARD